MLRKSVLVIGGATRNVGKTTLVCRILKQWGSEYNIISLKIKTIYPNDTFFHGTDRNPLTDNEPYRIDEEFLTDSPEDTSRMLRCGAMRSFKIKCKVEYIQLAYADFLSRIDDHSLIISESNSLNRAITPDYYLLIKHQFSDDIKPSARQFEYRAACVIFTDGQKHDFDISVISIKNNKWILKKNA